MRRWTWRHTLAVTVLCGLVLAGAGCHGWRAPTYATLTSMTKALDEARAELTPACAKAENAAADNAKSKDAGMLAIADIAKRCDAAADSLEAGAKVIHTARDGLVDEAKIQNDPASIAAWATGALNTYRNLKALLEILGVKLPSIGGV